MPGQTAFADAVLDSRAPVPPGLTNPDGAPAAKRFDVYRNNVVLSLIDALGTAFPVVKKLLGEAGFNTLAQVFVRAHPPRSPMLMFYGEALPRFIEGFEPLAKLGYLPDIARLEQALRESYHASDAAPIDPTALASLSPDALTATRMTLAPSARLIRSPWPIHAIWRFNMEPGAPKPSMAAEDMLVLRPEFDPVPIRLSPGDAAFLTATQAGRPIGTAFEAALGEQAEFDLTALLGVLLGHGAITELET
ncbi:MAG: DNA-binding domain-containing protein [Pseudomonadota bacterium]